MCETHYAQNRRGAELTPIRTLTPNGGYTVRQLSATVRDEHGRKMCSRCREWFDTSCFTSNRSNPDGLSDYCGDCRKWHKVKSSYGLTRCQFEELLASQSGTCATCNRTENLTVDHDHSCCPGKRSCGRCVRGILCGQCNSAVGMLSDSAETAARVAAYLDR